MTRSSAPPSDAPIVMINVWDEVADEVASGVEVAVRTSLIRKVEVGMD